jgi:hypothetical protein
MARNLLQKPNDRQSMKDRFHDAKETVEMINVMI